MPIILQKGILYIFAELDVSVSRDSNSIMLSWRSPDASGIWFSVLIYIVADEGTSTVECTDCTELTVTHYVFRPSPCYKYSFSVIPHNELGRGESTNICIESEFVCSI